MSSKEIAKKSDLASFYGLEGVNIALKASSFDVMEEVQTIIQLIRDPDPKVALPALKHFRVIMKEIASTNGVIGNVEHSISYNDKDRNANVRQSITSQKLLNTMKDQNEKDIKENEKNSNEETRGFQAHESLPPREV